MDKPTPSRAQRRVQKSNVAASEQLSKSKALLLLTTFSAASVFGGYVLKHVEAGMAIALAGALAGTWGALLIQQARHKRGSASQRIVEAALRERSHCLAQIIEMAPAALFLYDCREQRIVLASRAAAELFDARPENPSESSPFPSTRIHPDDRAAFDNLLAACSRPDGPAVACAALRMRGKAGGWLLLDCRAACFAGAPDGSAQRHLIAAADISLQRTEDRETQEELRRMSEVAFLQAQMMADEANAGRALRALMESALRITDGSAASIETRREIGLDMRLGGSLEYLGEEAWAIISLAVDDCFSKSIPQYIALPSGDESLLSAMAIPLRSGAQAAEGVLTVVSSSPDAFCESNLTALQHLADLGGAALHRALLFQSRQSLLTERSDAIDGLHESESRFRAAIGAVYEGMIVRERDGRIKDWNASAERILGFPVEELFAPGPSERGDWMLIHENRSEVAYDDLPDVVAMATGEPQSNRVMGIERADGTVTWLSVSAAPLFGNGQAEPYGAVTTFHDISQQKAAFEANARLAAIVGSSQDGVFSATLEGVIVNWNPGAENLFGYPADEIIGSATSILTPPNDPASFKTVIKRLLAGDDTQRVECIRFRKDGIPVHVSMTYSLIRNYDAEPIAIAVIARDVTDRVRYEEQIRQQMEQINFINVELKLQKEQLVLANEQLAALATLDGLSGLKNHRVFQERLAEEFNRSMRYKTPLTIFILDVDEFKTYNDSFGHPAGDDVLRAVSAILMENCRATDVVARYGGEEFVVILPQTTLEGALVIAERCRAKIEEHAWPLREITASFGISTLCEGVTSITDMVNAADQAMYQSKARGKNCVTHSLELSFRQAMASKDERQTDKAA